MAMAFDELIYTITKNSNRSLARANLPLHLHLAWILLVLVDEVCCFVPALLPY